MNKTIFTIALMVVGTIGMNAQSLAGKVGYTSGINKVDSGFGSASASQGGFHIGVVLDFEITESLSARPELLYTNIESSSFLQIPLLASYEIGETGLNAQLGPQVNFVLEDTGDDFSALSIALALGAGYDITDKLFVEVHYALQLNNSFTGENEIFEDGEGFFNAGEFSSKTNFLNLGVGYRFL